MPPLSADQINRTLRQKTKTSTTPAADTHEGKEGKTKHKTADLVPNPIADTQATLRELLGPGKLLQYQMSTLTGR